MKKPVNSRLLQNLELQNKSVGKKIAQNILGLDFGQKFCGLAFSPDGVCVVPLEVVATTNILERIKEISEAKNIQKIVLGLPLEKDGTNNKWCEEILLFAKKLTKTIPLEFVNERSSSQNIINTKKERIDDLAAAKILEFYLDKKE
ncbi:Holliday junction resolvase RuvX [Candidatus Gracilibacteria bacterium]|nr:Holliday junction resolvase RuvX [Candidatus Gracilibacteria bacterium]